MMHLSVIAVDSVQAQAWLAVARLQGWHVQHYSEPAAFFRAASRLHAQILVLDWNLPQMSGARVIERARHLFGHKLPIIVISSDPSEDVALQAWQLDADDFIHKPISPQLLCARISAVHRRHCRLHSERQQAESLHMPPFKLLRGSRSLLRMELPVALTPREFDLAWLLFSNSHRYMSRAELMASLWGARAELNSHTLAQHIHALRRKLDLASHGCSLRSVYGVGYRLMLPDTQLPNLAEHSPVPNKDVQNWASNG